jgi:hypothetical protein
MAWLLTIAFPLGPEAGIAGLRSKIASLPIFSMVRLRVVGHYEVFPNVVLVGGSFPSIRTCDFALERLPHVLSTTMHTARYLKSSQGVNCLELEH